MFFGDEWTFVELNLIVLLFIYFEVKKIIIWGIFEKIFFSTEGTSRVQIDS